MRDYSQVTPRFWLGETGRKLRGCQEAQIVSFYLMTNPHANMIGLYYLPIMFIAHETGLTLEGASKGLARSIEAGFCSYDEVSEVVWVHEMAKFQIGDKLSESDKRCKGVQNEYDQLPENRFLACFYEKYQAAFNLQNMRGNESPIEAPSKPHRSQEQEQEQEQEYIAAEKSAGDPLQTKEKKQAIRFATFLTQCKDEGKKPITTQDPVFDFADKAGIPDEFVKLAWLEFKSRYLESNKRYRDWLRVFRGSVRGNWFKLWYCDDSGAVLLTSQGRLLQKTNSEAAA